jgi:hypothetical protein
MSWVAENPPEVGELFFGGGVVVVIRWYNPLTGVITCGAIIPCNEVISCL